MGSSFRTRWNLLFTTPVEGGFILQGFKMKWAAFATGAFLFS